MSHDDHAALHAWSEALRASQLLCFVRQEHAGVTASEAGTAQRRIVVWRSVFQADPTCQSCLEQHIGEGDNPVRGRADRTRYAFNESGCLGMQPKIGGKLHLKLNIGTRPIANRYREGEMKRTLQRAPAEVSGACPLRASVLFRSPSCPG